MSCSARGRLPAGEGWGSLVETTGRRVNQGDPGSGLLADRRTSLSVVIPFHNEEENVEDVVAEIGGCLLASGIPYELVGVNSGSTDATGAILARLARDDDRVRVVSVERKGYGLAVTRGIKAASKTWLTIVSGDGQTDPRDILKAYAVMGITGADLVKPRRFSRHDGMHRRVLSVASSLVMKVVFGLPGWDFMGPPKIIKRRLLEALALESEDRFIDTELLLKAKELGVVMEEVGVTYRKRAAGTGKVRLGTIGEYLVNIVKWRVHYRRLVLDRVSGAAAATGGSAGSSALPRRREPW